MIRRLWKLALMVLLAAVAFMLMRMGQRASAEFGTPNELTINAFLFLVGLSSALALLSPPSQPRFRVRW